MAIGSVSYLSVASASADPAHQWALSYLHADQTWQFSRGVGVTVAVIDSGVHPNPDLESNLLPGADFSMPGGKSSSDGHTDTDANGHGTGMASLIGGSGNANGGEGTLGLAPGAGILPIRATTTEGAGLAFGLAPALQYASSHGARVINLSVVDTQDDPEIREAIRNAVDRDVVLVAGVGNDGSTQQYYPAAYPGVLGVGAINSTGDIWVRSNSGPDVAIVAPGVHVYRDDNQDRQGYSDGTSLATAYVSAAAALVRSAHPTWTAPQVISALTSTADKPPALAGQKRNDQYGYGILNVLAAVRLATPPPTSPPSASPSPSQPSAPLVGAPTPPPASIARESDSTLLYLIGGMTLLLAVGALIAVPVRRRH